MSGLIFDCPSAWHDHPLLLEYAEGFDEAARRLDAGWNHSRCPDCQHYGWEPPTAPSEGGGTEPQQRGERP